MEVDDPDDESMSMSTGTTCIGKEDMTKRWMHVRSVVERDGPLADPGFELTDNNFKFFQENAKILVIGAGGLGCELLKDLALMGFVSIEVIDMDIVDLSNLNRQFLFRPRDVNRPKAVVAAEFVNNRVQGCNVIPHYNRIQDKDESFYAGFSIVVCGLDSIVARRWINGMLHSLLQYNEDGEVVGGIVPLVDGGTEGFKGNTRVIIPGITACIECNLDLFPPQITFPMCTIANTPRLPEHCIEFVRVIQWAQDEPFGENVAIDGDDPLHIQWIYEQSVKRANSYSINGITYRLTQGVIKNIIPAVASTNAVIAAVCANEVFKLATSCYPLMNNYMVFNDTNGIYTYTFETERKEDCPACCQAPLPVAMEEEAVLQDFIDHLSENARTQMKAPGVTTTINGKSKTLYMQNIPSLEEVTRKNLTVKLTDLGLQDGQELIVSDVTSPKPTICKLQFIKCNV